jgi:translation initiation factor IF-2
MSVRIHQLSKQIGMENKELIELLRSRGFEVKSASSTVDNISAESLVEEFAKKSPEPEAVVSDAASEEPTEEKETSMPEASLPKGSIVKSAEDVKQERELKQGLKQADSKTDAGAVPNKGISPPKANTPPVPPVPPTPNTSSSAPPKPSSPPPTKPITSAAKASEVLPSQESPVNEEDSEVSAKIIHVKPPIVVRDFAQDIGLKPFKLISELMEIGIFASMNQTIEESTAQELAKRHGFKLEIHHRGEAQQDKVEKKEIPKLDEDDPKFLKPRPPICCILGHVDHGKTTLLDTIRKTSVVESEAGGITQHIGAYQVEHEGNLISFVDTPGHAAFSNMRSRGTDVTDIAILVIAADDGFKPQTEEALKLAKAANNSIIVAINKIDSKGANVDQVKKEMQEKGIQPEDWGGDTVTVEVSALNGTNVSELLEMIILQAEILELKANPDANPAGSVIEAQIEQGRGAVASVIVQKGTLKRGDALVCGESYCRVKSMMDAQGNNLNEASPSTPVRIIGWSEVPKSGDQFNKEKSEKVAKRIAEASKSDRKISDSKQSTEEKTEGASTVEDLFAAIEKQQKKCLRLIVKSDVHGSMEALVHGLEAINTDKVDVDIIAHSVGNITKSDITLASAGDATIVGFNVKLDNGVQSLAKHESVKMIQHAIIYELLDQVEESMVDLLDAEVVESKSGVAEVRQVFGISKGRQVAGCMVTEGVIPRSGKVRLLRGKKLIFEGPVDTLRRFKDDVKEVRAGYECGINIKGCNDYAEGDILECFQIEKKKPSLR